MWLNQFRYHVAIREPSEAQMELDHKLLDRFLSRILELHRSGVLSETDAVGELAEVVALAANGNLALGLR